jgi:hypothetical protein
VSASFKYNNINSFETDFDNTSYYEYVSAIGKIKILQAGKYHLVYTLLIYNLSNEKNSCSAQVIRNGSTINGSVVSCYLNKTEYNVTNMKKSLRIDSCSTLEDSLYLNCNENDEISLQFKSYKSCKIDHTGTKFSLTLIG